MVNYSVKTFENDSLMGLELEIDSWLHKNKDIRAINISHSDHKIGYSTYYTAIILYEI